MSRSLHNRQEVNVEPGNCGLRATDEEYNLSLHIGALFIILFVSVIACAFPLIVTKIPRLKINPNFLFVARHFGTGVLIATAFVHLLPTAFVSLTDPCLPAFWNEDYPAMAGAIALAAVFFITTIEMTFSPGRHACCSNVKELTEITESAERVCAMEQSKGIPEDIPRGPIYGRSISGRSQSTGRTFSQLATQHCQESITTSPIEHGPIPNQQEQKIKDSGSSIEEDFTVKEATQQRRKALVQCVMLEMGILFHSIFIGMALAVAVGNAQIVLLVAIVFHQMFEGLALGSRIAAVGWERKDLQPWLMAMAYGCTTPLGQALGISTRNLYDPNSQTGLLVVGIMNAISSGFLTFNSLIDLLSEDFLSDRSWETLRGARRKVAFSLVFFGAFCMSLIGAWA